MSWDFYLIRTKTNTEPYNQIMNENIIGFSKSEIVDEVISLADELHLEITDEHTKFLHLRGDGWSIEFCFWDEVEPFETVDMQMRGINEPIEVLFRLKKDLNTRIFDMHGERFIDENSSSGFDKWKKFTQDIVSDITNKENHPDRV